MNNEENKFNNLLLNVFEKGLKQNQINNILFILLFKDVFTAVYQSDYGSWSYKKFFILELSNDSITNGS